MHAPVYELVDAGEIAPRQRVSVGDLDFATTWLEHYEGDSDEDAKNLTALATVARYLRRESARREARRRPVLTV